MKGIHATLKLYFLLLVCVGGLFSSFIKMPKNTHEKNEGEIKCQKSVSLDISKTLFLSSVER